LYRKFVAFRSKTQEFTGQVTEFYKPLYGRETC